LTRRRRGDIYYAELGDIGRKPVLVVSWDAINDGLKRPICALITSVDRERALPTYVAIEPNESGLRETSYVLCHALATLVEEVLDPAPVGTLPPWRMTQVTALSTALDLAGG
jgi:mRNA-degrading endonuclease toxin of MazEF toxin-antitoxin module